jgi:hypothetical protein
MKSGKGAPGLRCKPDDVVRIASSTNTSLIGLTALVQTLRSDGRWNVLLEKPVAGVTATCGRPIVTREYSFRDESLVPIVNLSELDSEQLNHLVDAHRHPGSGLPEGEIEAP